ncbi:MAG: T9SS type A sorting domain-containing protein [Candidatus Cloacimonetes bacterium]|nr:T9SS type A sorting domain-containing protein [Candidatus Cloacimonadota bacterium]
MKNVLGGKMKVKLCFFVLFLIIVQGLFATNYCLYFDGISDLVNCGDANINYGDSFTVEGWIKMPDEWGGDRSWIAHWKWNSGSPYYGFFFRIGNTTVENDKAYFAVADTDGNSLGFQTDASIQKNVWVHLAGVYTGTNSYIYVNGNLAAGTQYGSTNGTVGNPNQNLYFAYEYWIGGMYMNVSIDEIRIWDDVRTQTEIQNNMYNELTGNEQGLVGYWKLNENGGVTAFDSKGNNDGTLVGLPDWIVCDSPLPVTLSSFTADYSNGSSNLCWTTQSETNNLGWNVYRGESETALENNTSICLNNSGLIPGAGTTTEPTDYSFQDQYPVLENSTYWYWLESVSGSGETENYGPISLSIPEEENNTPDHPSETILYGNHPNPFNPLTNIQFDIKENETGVLYIFNLKGQIIESQRFNSGKHDYLWNAENFSSGVYFYKLQTESFVELKKMLLLK